MLKKKGFWIALIVVLLAAGGGYYFYTTQLPAQAQDSTKETLKTTKARKGEILLTAVGAGTVVSSVEVDLAFGADGEVTAVNVAAGDDVVRGDILASIDDTSARKSLASAQSNVESATQALINAQYDYDELMDEATEAELLSAQASLASAKEKLADLLEGPTQAEVEKAQASVANAQASLDDLINGPDEDEVTQAQLSLDKAKNSLYSAQMSRDSAGIHSTDSSQYKSAEVSVWNQEISVQQAQMTLDALMEPATETEIQNAKATLSSAQEALDELLEGATAAEIASAEANLAKAQEALDELNEGPLENEIAVAQSKVTQAELSLENAELNLEDAEESLEDTDLVATLDATVMEVKIEVGERATENTTVITLADLATPQIEVYVDESDMAMVQVGYECTVEFDALPDEVFTGHVVSVDPQLQTVSGTYVVLAVVELDAGSFAKPESLMPGMNATLEIVGGHTENAVLVPVEALRDLGDGQYAVFVVENGTPRMRLVEVGLMDYTYAEILSGVEVGEEVSTGIVETN